jgi:2-succinyl-6-hydroxy-2,4-cyclohexadiene-1-carboxylate synthase
MSRLTVDRMQYYVECWGEGAPLVLLHGFTGSSATWAPHVASWPARAIAVDLPGHGQTDAPADSARYRMEATVADLVALLDQLGVERAHVLGYSMGGRVALHLAAAHPERVATLILESASPGLATQAERAARVAADTALAASIGRDGIAAFVDRWEALQLWASQARLPDAVRAGLRAQRLNNRPLGLANSLRGLGTGAQAPLHYRLADLPVPALVIAGMLDAKFAAIARAMAAALPQGRLALVPEAGHAVHLEQPALFDRLVAEFLEEHALLAAFSPTVSEREIAPCR